MKLAPIVTAQASLSAEELSRYSRHILLPEIGLQGQQRLKNSRVLVIGAGGLGSPALLYLAAAGIGTLGIIDFDRVEASNLQRQIIHRMATIGTQKIESARQAIQDLNPHVQVELHNLRLDNSNAIELFQQYDLILDGTDNFATRYLVNDACVLTNKPYVWGSIYRFEGQASVFWDAAPGGGLNYRDLYPEPPPPEFAPSCAEGGVLGILCASIASIMATEAVKLITGTGESLLGRLVVYDALPMSYRFLPLQRAPERQPITELVDYQQLCGLYTPAASAIDSTLSSIGVTQLKQWLESESAVDLIDVREPNEWDIVRIPGARLVTKRDMLAQLAYGERLDRQHRIVVYCKAGGRSREVVHAMRNAGYENVYNLEGGVLAWVSQVDPTLPAY